MNATTEFSTLSTDNGQSVQPNLLNFARGAPSQRMARAGAQSTVPQSCLWTYAFKACVFKQAMKSMRVAETCSRFHTTAMGPKRMFVSVAIFLNSPSEAM